MSILHKSFEQCSFDIVLNSTEIRGVYQGCYDLKEMAKAGKLG